jgi:hypothetical protein
MTFMIRFMQWNDKLGFCSDQQFLQINPFIGCVGHLLWVIPSEHTALLLQMNVMCVHITIRKARMRHAVIYQISCIWFMVYSFAMSFSWVFLPIKTCRYMRTIWINSFRTCMVFSTKQICLRCLWSVCLEFWKERMKDCRGGRLGINVTCSMVECN